MTRETMRMTDNGTATYTNPEDYQAAIERANLKLTITAGADFKAYLTWLKLRNLRVLRGCETLPVIAYISLPSALAFVSFPTAGSSPVWDGLELRVGDVVFHSRGERMHRWTNGESQWGLVSLPPEELAACAKALTGVKMMLPPVGRVLRPSRTAAARLLRLHSKASRLAETRHELIAKPEVTRALEQELLHALVHCLTADDAGGGNIETRRHHADIMVRFEEALTAYAGRRFTLPELCTAIGVPERTLRMCCAEFLGMGPTRYLLLRRLNMARSALLRADPATASVAEIARDCQFTEPGRFAVTYRTIFGEIPSATLRRGATE
jgi:AraC-like DNA-binding protein